MSYVLGAVRRDGAVLFSDLCSELDRTGIIVTFLAILELIRRGRVGYDQPQSFARHPSLRCRACGGRKRDLMQTELVETGEFHQKIEALLFVAPRGALDQKTRAGFCEAEEMDVATAVAEIEAEYAERGIVVRKIAGGYRFSTAASAREVVETYLLPPRTTLSPAALESLAIIAYNEHLEGMSTTKAEIEAIRGVERRFGRPDILERGFIAETGRKEVPGRPILYKNDPRVLGGVWVALAGRIAEDRLWESQTSSSPCRFVTTMQIRCRPERRNCA